MTTDRAIQQDVHDELSWEPSVDASTIGVHVDHGIVTLVGEVPTFREKHQAEKAALRVRGVQAVANDLMVETLPVHRRTDAEIAQSVLTALALNVAVPPDRVRIVVREGDVMLEGELDWHYQRNAAARSARDIAGVTSVIDLIRLRPRVLPRDVKQKITAAFHRNAQLDADQVIIDVEGNRVTLRGSVSSYGEKSAAERAAWGAPGVTDVKNLISVQSHTLTY